MNAPHWTNAVAEDAVSFPVLLRDACTKVLNRGDGGACIALCGCMLLEQEVVAFQSEVDGVVAELASVAGVDVVAAARVLGGGMFA